MKTDYVLIDFESVQVKSLALLSGDQFRVHLFLGPHHACESSAELLPH